MPAARPNPVLPRPACWWLRRDQGSVPPAGAPRTPLPSSRAGGLIFSRLVKLPIFRPLSLCSPLAIGLTATERRLVMRITLLNQYYPPDLAPTASLCAGLATALANAGHEVTVLASQGGYAGPATAGASDPTGGVKVVRLRTPAFGKRRLVGRLIDYSCYYLRTAWALLRSPPQDVIVSLTTPPFIALTALLHRVRSRDTRLVLWNMDCYPEAAEITGCLRTGGAISRLLRRVSGLIIRRAEQIVCLDRAMAQLLQSHYGAANSPLPISIVPNWEPAALFPSPARSLSTPPGDPAAPLTVLYQGNAGMGHEFHTLADAATQLRDEPIDFRFVGGGKWWSWLGEQAANRGLRRWELNSYIAKEQVPALLASVDVALITLRHDAGGVMSPSKLHSCLAAGLPILYIGPPDSNVDDCLRRYGCGGSFRNGDVAGVVQFLRGLRENPQTRSELGQAARRAFDAEYTDRRQVPVLCRLIEAVARPAAQPVRPVSQGAPSQTPATPAARAA